MIIFPSPIFRVEWIKTNLSLHSFNLFWLVSCSVISKSFLMHLSVIFCESLGWDVCLEDALVHNNSLVFLADVCSCSASWITSVSVSQRGAYVACKDLHIKFCLKRFGLKDTKIDRYYCIIQSLCWNIRNFSSPFRPHHHYLLDTLTHYPFLWNFRPWSVITILVNRLVRFMVIKSLTFF